MQQSTSNGSDSSIPGEQFSIAQKSLDDAIEQAFIPGLTGAEFDFSLLCSVDQAGKPPESAYLIVMQDTAQENTPLRINSGRGISV